MLNVTCLQDGREVKHLYVKADRVVDMGSKKMFAYNRHRFLPIVKIEEIQADFDLLAKLGVSVD